MGNYMSTISAGNTTTTTLTQTGDLTGNLAFVPITGYTSFTGTGYSPVQVLTDGANISWTTTSGQVATLTINGNRTFLAPTGMANGAFYSIQVIQGIGGNTISWNSVFRWVSNTAPTLSTANAARDFFVFRSDGTNMYEQGRAQGEV
jgi:hypothetical protein